MPCWTRWMSCAGISVAAPLSALLGQGADSARNVRIPPPRVAGVVFDSVARRPLAGAWVVAGAITATTDSAGRFTIDSVPAGPLRITVQHDAIDALGLNALVADVPAIAGTRVDVMLGTPSRATLWRAACPGLPVPATADTAFVYGSIRDATRRRPVAGVAVTAVWFDFHWAPGSTGSTDGWQADGVSDSTGTYALCGVPTDAVIQLRATSGADSTAALDLRLDGRLVVRRDLLIAPPATRTGIVSGTIVDAVGNPHEGARIRLDGVDDARTDARGRFVLHGVPLGSRQLHVIGVGYAPVVVPVDVRAGDTASVRVKVERLTLLSTVHVAQTTLGARFKTEFEARKKSGMGYYSDSTRISRMTTLSGVLGDFPSMTVVGKRDNELQLFFKDPNRPGDLCAANVFIDGLRSDITMLQAYRKDDLAAVEVYPRAAFAPSRYLPSLTICGSVLVWTKWAFR